MLGGTRAVSGARPGRGGPSRLPPSISEPGGGAAGYRPGVLSDGQHGAHGLDAVAGGELGEGALHGGEELLGAQETADGGVIEDQHVAVSAPAAQSARQPAERPPGCVRVWVRC